MQRTSLHKLTCGAKQIGFMPSYWTIISGSNDRAVEPSKGSLGEGRNS